MTPNRAANTGSAASAGSGASPTGPDGAAPAHSPHGRALVNLAAVVIMLAAAGATHGAVFGDSSGYIAVGGGIALGTAIAAAAAHWRWSAFETGLAGVVGYLLAGGPIALPSTTTSGVIPTLSTLQGLIIGAVQAWKDVG